MYQTHQPEWLPALDIAPPVRQRRLTVLLRLLLLVPQFIVMAVLGVVTFFVAIAAWFAALVLGGLPGWAESYLSGYVAYTTRVYASLYLLVDRYPPFSFTDPGSPVQVEFHPGRLNRLAVLFRIILAIPAGIIAAVLTAGWEALSFFCWLVVLILGRTPEPLFEATAAILRYTMRLQAYFLMLTPAYPKRLFGDRTPAEVPPAPEPGTGTAGTTGTAGAMGTGGAMGAVGAMGAAGAAGAHGAAAGGWSATRPLLLSGGGKIMLALFIIFGLIGVAVPSSESGSSTNQSYSASAARP
jgi:hypothetical protein